MAFGVIKVQQDSIKKLMIAILVIFLAIVAWIAFRYVWISYYNRGSNYMNRGEYDQAILCFDKTIKIQPKFAPAYYQKKEYDKAWEDVHKAESMEFQVPPDFLKALRDASGREN